MHRIAVVVVSPVMTADVAIPHMVFGALPGGYELRLCAAEPGSAEAVDGPDVPVPHGLEAVADADSVIVVGSGGREGVEESVLAAVRAAHAEGKRVASICTGAFVLAEAGLLDGRRATTHWALTGELARRFPAIAVAEEVLFVEDGRVVTSAGAAAGIELCLHLVRADHGADAAAEVGRRALVAPPRPAAQPQVVRAEEPGALAATRAWALERLDAPLSLADLAAHARVSPRTLTRRFHAETGQSPLQWLLCQRVEHARELLETTDLPMGQVAHRSGLGTADSLRQHLLRRVGLTPRDYRQRAKTPSAS
ncbi:GlxA family transcriptional regulator [Spirillospora sp. CA-294931]|uniref:GlxA family transcriptional regulator n=1 Tax=Spirillospora sp. CA-294931 TaxID=3240042 RepID=UPI003D90A5A6